MGKMQISESLTVLEMIYQKLYIGVLIILALMLFVCLIRAVKGPRVADRLMAEIGRASCRERV